MSFRRHITTQTSTAPPLSPCFAALKTCLIAGHEDSVGASWHDLLSVLRRETEDIKSLSTAAIPEIHYGDIGNGDERAGFRDELRKRRVAVVRGVVRESEALS